MPHAPSTSSSPIRAASPLAPALAAKIVDLARRENFPAGHRLTEQFLCEHLGVSRSPVRKALQHLQTQGIVTSVPNKGFQLAVAGEAMHAIERAQPQASPDDFYLRIARDRIAEVLPPSVTESELMARYGIARPLLLRVLTALARDGLVDRRPGRGWTFRRLVASTDAHRQSYRFRMMIEPAAILEPGYAPDLAELRRCRQEQQRLLALGAARCTPAELFEAGVHFHETVVAGSGNAFALDALRNVNQMRRIVEYGTRLDDARLQQQCGEHLQLIDLLERNERMEAAQLMRQHLNVAQRTKVG